MATAPPCPGCGHAAVSGKCRFCAKPRRTSPCADPTCAYCQQHTLASDARAVALWADPTCAPREVWRTSSRPVRVRCPECASEATKQALRVSTTGCALCANPNERAVFEVLRATGRAVAHQVVDGAHRYDFVVDGTVVVEVDGPQHFRPVRSWRTGVDLFSKDLEKEEHATASGRAVVRVLQTDVRDDAGDWRAFLREAVARAAPGTVQTPERPEYRRGVYARLRVGRFF